MKDGMASDYYQAEKGKNYAMRIGHNDLNHLGYTLQAQLFQPYLTSEDTVLDFGCANGSLVVALRKTIKKIEGLEINETTRKIALSQEIHTYGSLEEIPGDKRYHKIISNHVLEHIPNAYGTLCALREKLHPGGKLIVVVPIEDIRQKENRVWVPHNLDRHLHTWTPLQFGNLLDEAGLIPEHLDIITQAWHPKLFFLGTGVLQRLAGWMLASVKCRRQLLAVASRRS
ncbi:hypothetical protein GETHOR_25670 [Geothrix oryzae]|uniref:Methyltransferase domain-containing protein n=1 Tax=Geothrix oryzae TaxID=2927975 RepID=A0ABN6V0R3_9BACT|nr:class I SAM-dependent methyltransferase [Geothrix oryzae]BDU70466.1 hypothetical protein GETHOR_25670 [Geothrix oryzae]